MDKSSRKRATHLQSALNSLKKSAQFCKHVTDGETTHEDINVDDLQHIAFKYCEKDVEYSQFENTLKETEQYFKDNKNENEKNVSVTEKLNEISKSNTTPANNQTFSEHPFMIEFLKSIQQVEFENDNKDDDDDIQDEFTPPIDPITKNTIKCPVKNPQCGHVYDLDSITQLIGVRKNTRCPYIGCPALAYIKLNALVRDTELENKIRRYNYNH